MAFSRHIQTTMSKWYWVSKLNKFNHRSLFNNMWKQHSDLCFENRQLEATWESYDLNNLINMPTCYQSNNPTCIDIILTSKKNLLYGTFETGLSDHHKLISTILKPGGFKGKPKEKYIDHIGNLTSKILKKIWNLASAI